MMSQRLSDSYGPTMSMRDAPAARRSLQPHRLVLAAMALLLCLPAWAQGPEGYAVPHLFALPTATTTRQFGMGGTSSCLPDIGFPNPAFAGMLTGTRAGLRASWTDFDGGLDLTGTQAWYATPVGEGQGIQVLGFWLDSNRGGVMTPMGTVPGEIEEHDVAFHYGRRMSDTWLLGIGVSPILETEMNLYHPVDGSLVQHSDSEARLGGRLGTVYQFAPEGFAGFVFDWYTEDVNFQGPGMPAPMSFDFTSTEWALGVSMRLSPEMLAAAEWMELESKDGALVSRTDGLHVGVEYRASDRVLVRLGSSDAALTAGAGMAIGSWVINYAYIADWNGASVGAAFGGSDTHQVEIGGYW